MCGVLHEEHDCGGSRFIGRRIRRRNGGQVEQLAGLAHLLGEAREDETECAERDARTGPSPAEGLRLAGGNVEDANVNVRVTRQTQRRQLGEVVGNAYRGGDPPVPRGVAHVPERTVVVGDRGGER